MENRPLAYAKDIRSHLKKIISEEASSQDFEVLKDGTKKVIVGLTADSGGGSNKISISLMNTKEGVTAKDHVIMMYEAADTLQNLIKCFSKGLRKDFEVVNNSILEINDEKYLVYMQGVFDLKCQDEMIGAQGSSCVLPCAKCLVTKSHLQNHGGKPHSKEN